jgi:hypothetical protein
MKKVRSTLGLMERLPAWGKLIVIVLGIVCGLYAIAHYGLGSLVLHAIFSP